jgi:acetylornithine/N-succinyldiaminopimelate aminotransferase
MSSLLGVYDRDLVVVSGRGSYLFDSEGRKYLDFAAGVGVNGLGYGDRKVVAAIRKQAGQLIHASNLYHTETGAALADRLVSLAFPSRVFFCNSGTEAMEAAIKFARRIGKPAGRTALVAFEGSFHGRTMGSLSLTWTAKYREPFEPLIPGVRFCAWNDLDAARQAVGEDTAAVVVEPVQGEGGVRPAPPAFLKGLSELCRKRGALLVADEIQCGLGRTGKLFAHQHAGIVPDILTLAKPLGGGLPLGAVLLREELASEIKPGDHGSTFGGNPVALAASMAVIDRLT